MGKIIVFNITKMGASHKERGKPCQDYSLSWESEDKKCQVAIVCDGHGGDTYVRSEIGSKLAANIALDNIRSFISSTSAKMFLGKNAAVTARPEEDDSLFPKTQIHSKKDLTEIEIQQQEQDKAFYAAVESVREQDCLFNRLFASIYLQWLNAIQKDADDHPFTEEEKSHLKNAKIVKAYGSTLMAFVRTPLYWFAFHIGDGKLVVCDRNMTWREPVPWDCNCFLNVTTSLCNSNPIPLFRYAFSGVGDFPSAVILGSDGLDDSWGTMDLLQNFYSQTLSIFDKLGEEQAVKELAEYLPELSKKASKDDMSMAGIIDMDEIKDAVALYKMHREIKVLAQEKNKKQSELTSLKEQYEYLKSEGDQLSNMITEEKQSFLDWCKRFLNQKEKKEKEIQLVEENLSNKKQEEESLRIVYDQKSLDYQKWFVEAKKQKEKLEKNIQLLQQANALKSNEGYEHWKQVKEAFVKQEEKLREERLKAKASLMEACNEDALNALKSDETVEEREDSFQELFSEKGIDELEIKEDIKDAEG